jgi:long-chain acyl-CoA synthetase
VEALAAPPDAALPGDWEAQVEGWGRPAASDLAKIIFTSGTTGVPKGVMLSHANILASVEAAHRIIAPQQHRVVSLLPLSHLLEQVTALYYALTVGADILYVRSRNPRVIFEAIRDHRVTTMVVVPQVLDLFWSSIEREVEKAGRQRTFGRLRRVARHLPYRLRRILFRRVHARLGGRLNLFVCAGAFLPPALQQAWEDLGVVVMQGYGATECGPASVTTKQDHGLGTVGKPIEGFEVRLSPANEILMRGPSLFQGYWRDPEATRKALTEDGWYRTGDIGRFDATGHLILMGRTRDIIVLPNGFNVYPEDIENALRTAGIRDSVVVETQPGRIEAVVLAPSSHTLPQGGDIPASHDGPAGGSAPEAIRAALAGAVRTANAAMAVHQRVAGWRLWPDEDFPRTHTLKVKRDEVRRWAVVDAPLPVQEDANADPAVTLVRRAG